MNLLAFDTSGPVMSVALKCGNTPILEKVRSAAWGHMEELLPFADELLRERNLKITDVESFLLNRGPGSFTGLRIGFSTLLGLIAANPKPCFGVDSLDLLTERIPCENHSHLAVCLDAFRSKFYTKIFENKNNQWQACGSSQALEMNQALELIPEKAFISGNALDRYRNLFEASQKSFTIAAQDLWSPRASSLIRLYQNDSPAVKKLVSSEDFLPVYLRLSEPEERKAELKLK
ncbi:MAG TPA: tRNA (adenosine(37)-N6)-threonylcarbamoyltransferase complex dimerization subunit type 1 TsaB [Candidatus Omnitrophica bacterium]|nr:tRNA (adenosine(37)-N6)-threonylcarbamoyltransferase complex dimerization subunit type 1 TsaB [Candidatus Omnitrophota bacterium]